MLWLAAAGLLLFWGLQPGAGLARQSSGLVLILLLAWSLHHGWQGLARGALTWDGRQWWLEVDEQARPVLLQVWADGGAWLWLQANVQAREAWLPWLRSPRWLWLAQELSPHQWGPLRRAVYFPPRLCQQLQ